MPDAVLTELLVSGHLMRLDAGLFCLFAAPDTPPPDPASGLPGVRLSVPPGASGLPGRVTIRDLRGDGWVGGEDAAALVRVTGGPAHLLVTVYQAKGAELPAPRLQVLRLAGPAATAAPVAPRRSSIAPGTRAAISTGTATPTERTSRFQAPVKALARDGGALFSVQP